MRRDDFVVPNSNNKQKRNKTLCFRPSDMRNDMSFKRVILSFGREPKKGKKFLYIFIMTTFCFVFFLFKIIK